MTKIKAWLGIDPGKKGAMALVTKENEIDYCDWSNANSVATTLKEWIERYDINAAAIEDVSMNPLFKSGVSKLMQNKGEWIGLTAAFEIPLSLIRPQKWQKAMLQRVDGADTKTQSVNKCMRLYPDSNIFKGPKGGKKDGRADAVLLALYLKQFLGE